MKVIIANRLESLLGCLLLELNSFHRLPQKKTIVVASRGMKGWIKEQIAKSDLAIFFGFEILTLRQFFHHLPPEEVRLSVYKNLRNIAEIDSYLEGKEEREVSGALHFASLFESYRQLGWAPPLGHWQERLFRAVSFPPFEAKEKEDLFFFGFSYLPRPLLAALPESTISFFISPTSYFWEDVRKEDSLLGKWGKVGQKMNRFLLDAGLDGEGIFSIHREAEQFPPYNEFLTGEEFFSEEGPFNQLQALQADLMIAREGKSSFPPDGSIEVHVVSSKEREVEVLKNEILKMVGIDLLDPGEILVMARDLTDYLPLIKAHFEKSDFPFPVTYQEAHYMINDASWCKLQSFFRLPDERFRASSIRSFFSEDPLIDALDLLIEVGGITWGWVPEDRLRILGISKETSEPPFGTWNEGFKTIFDQLVLPPSSADLLEDPLPPSKIGDLSYWIGRLETLRKDLSPLILGEKMNVAGWVTWLTGCMERYLPLEGNQELVPLLNGFSLTNQTSIPFRLFLALLEDKVLSLESGAVPFPKRTIHFSSLGPMRAVPKKVIWLLGLEGDNFPSKNSSMAEDLAETHPDRVTRRDEDRYACLETVLAAREKLVLSFVSPRLSKDDSSIVRDLLSHVELCPLVHPRFRFDPLRFQGPSPFQSFSEKDYELTSESHSASHPPHPLPVRGEIRIKDLLMFAKDPLRTHFKSLFQTSLPYLGSSLPEEEPFFLPYLEELSLERYNRVNKKYKLPPRFEASFNKIALNEKEFLISQSKKNLCKLEIDRTFSYLLHQDCHEPVETSSGDWIYPPLKVLGHQLVGRIGPLVARGVLAEGKGDQRDIYQVWPLLLLAVRLGLPATVIFPTSGKVRTFQIDHPENALNKFIELYLMGREKPIVFHESQLDSRHATFFSPVMEEGVLS